MCSFDLPRCVRRLSEPIPGTCSEMVAYAVATADPAGSSGVRMVTSLKELDSLSLDECFDMNEIDVSGLQAQLADRVRKTFEPMQSVSRLEMRNQTSGHAQVLLTLLISDSLLPPIGFTETSPFWPTVKELDRILAERDTVLVPRLRVSTLRQIQEALIFDILVPQAGEETMPSLPVFLVSAALNAVCRLAGRDEGQQGRYHHLHGQKANFC